MKTLVKIIVAGLILSALLSALCPGAQKQSPPAGGTPKDFVLPAQENFQLDNGLKVTLVPYGQIPMVAMRLFVRCGNLNEPESEVWLADIAVKLMKEGTKRRSAKEIAAAAARMGGDVNAGVGMDQSALGGDVLSEFGPDFIRLVADIVQNPLFPATELERLKNDFLRDLSIQLSQPQTLALAKFRKAIYKNHPYGRILSTEDIIRGFTAEKIKGFYEENFGALRSHIYVVGRFDTQAVKQAIRESFGGWTRGPEPLLLPSTTDARRSLYIVDRPGAQQSTMYIGLPVPDPSHKDNLAVRVMNAILGGGGFLSRITSNIREKKGYTYSPYSAINTFYMDSCWFQFASVGNAVTAAALKEILYEIDRLREEAPGEEELNNIKNYASGTFVLTNSSRGGILSILAFQDLHGLGSEYLTTYVQKVQALAPQEIQRVAQEYLRPEKIVIVIVGDKKEIAESLKEFGPIVE